MGRDRINPDEIRAAEARRIAELEHQKEFEILSALVEESNGDPARAVSQINGLIMKDPPLVEPSENLESRGEPWDHVYVTCVCVVEVARRSPPEKHSKLVAFVLKLQETTLIDPSTGEPRVSGDGTVWTELGPLNIEMTDEYHTRHVAEPEHTPEDRRRIENFNAFLAQLTAASVDSYTDKSIYATYCFRQAFGPWENDGPHAKDWNIPPNNVQYAIRVACHWYIFTADKLWAKYYDENYDETPEGVQLEDKEYYQRRNEAWDLAKWDYYKQALFESEVKYKNQETKRLIVEAIKHVKRVEEGRN